MFDELLKGMDPEELYPAVLSPKSTPSTYPLEFLTVAIHYIKLISRKIYILIAFVIANFHINKFRYKLRRHCHLFECSIN